MLPKRPKSARIKGNTKKKQKVKKMFKFMAQFVLISGVILFFSHVMAFAGDSASAASLPLDDDKFREAGIIAPPEGVDDPTEILETVVSNALGYLRMIVVVIGILYITIAGYKLVTGGSDEEKVTQSKKSLAFIVIAFVLISMSEELARLFDLGERTIIDSPTEILSRVRIFDRQVELFITFVKYILGAFATLMIVRSALQLVASGAEEEERTKAKKSIGYSIGGLLLIYVGDIFINRVFYVVDKSKYTGVQGLDIGVDASEGVKQLAGITNLVISFVGPVAVLMLIIGAVMYATAGGNEESMDKAKRLIITTVAGIAIIYGAFAIVSTILSGTMGIE